MKPEARSCENERVREWEDERVRWFLDAGCLLLGAGPLTGKMKPLISIQPESRYTGMTRLLRYVCYLTIVTLPTTGSWLSSSRMKRYTPMGRGLSVKDMPSHKYISP